MLQKEHQFLGPIEFEITFYIGTGEVNNNGSFTAKVIFSQRTVYRSLSFWKSSVAFGFSPEPYVPDYRLRTF